MQTCNTCNVCICAYIYTYMHAMPNITLHIFAYIYIYLHICLTSCIQAPKAHVSVACRHRAVHSNSRSGHRHGRHHWRSQTGAPQCLLDRLTQRRLHGRRWGAWRRRRAWARSSTITFRDCNSPAAFCDKQLLKPTASQLQRWEQMSTASSCLQPKSKILAIHWWHCHAKYPLVNKHSY